MAAVPLALLAVVRLLIRRRGAHSAGGAALDLALLATIVDTVTGEDGSGLTGCSNDQLLGIISGARRQECRNAWILLTAIKEFARRAGTGLAAAPVRARSPPERMLRPAGRAPAACGNGPAETHWPGREC